MLPISEWAPVKRGIPMQEKCKMIAVGFPEFTPANRSRTVSEVARSVLHQKYQKQICMQKDMLGNIRLSSFVIATERSSEN